MSERKYYWWHEMTGPEVIDFAKTKSDIAILPIGATDRKFKQQAQPNGKRCARTRQVPICANLHPAIT